MTIDQEKRLLLIGIAKLQRQCVDISTTISDQVDIIERIRTLNHCLQSLCWRELDRRRH